jgi:hypothetical protein
VKRCLAVAAILSLTSPVLADTLTLSTSDCRRLVQHVPSDDVTYKPGVDVRGKPVVPADLGGDSPIVLPEEINIQIGIDLADRLALRGARGTPTTPGVPGPTAAARPVMPFEGKGHIGVLSVKGNDVFWNGARIAPQDEVLLAEACRTGLNEAGVVLPEPKP